MGCSIYPDNDFIKAEKSRLNDVKMKSSISSPVTEDKEIKKSENKYLPKQTEIKDNKTESKLLEVKRGKNMSNPERIEINERINLSISKEEEKKDIENLSIRKEEEIMEKNNISISRKEKLNNDENTKKEEKNPISHKRDNKENEVISNSNGEEKNNKNIILPLNNINDSHKYENPLSKMNKLENKFYSENKMNMFLTKEGNPLEKFNYFNIDFSNCNYMFIIPEQICDVFSSFYTNELKNSLIIFPKDYEQAKELLKDLEDEEDIKENWIIICPCVDLEYNIKDINSNKNIYRIILYCPFFRHEHNLDFFFTFPKFYGFANSYNELIEKLFRLCNIYYFRKRQNYEIKIDKKNIIELNYDTKFLLDFNNECSMNNIKNFKPFELYEFRMNQDICYFSIIQSYTFLNNYIENNNYDLFFVIFQNNIRLITLSNDILEKTKIASNFLKNLHLLYLYFSNYPYLFGVLTDEEINEILSQFQPDSEDIAHYAILVSGYNSLILIVNDLTSLINNGLSILNKKQELKKLQKSLIEFKLMNEQIFSKFNIPELIEFYQIKNFLRDIDFCIGITIIYIIKNTLINYPSKFEIRPSYLNLEKRFQFNFFYSKYLKKDSNIENDQVLAFNNSIKYNETIILGDNYFHDLIKKMNIPCENIYYLNQNQFSYFFQVPKKIEGKYKICKYFIIMNEKYGNEYMDTIRYINNVFGIKFIIILYIENKDIKIHKNIVQCPFMPIIITYSEKDILNYYYDNYTRLNKNYLLEYEISDEKIYEIDYDFPKLNETKFIKEQDNGWDMIKTVNKNIFKLISVNKFLGYIDLGTYSKNMYKVYKENNCLDLFIKYYGNYFACDYLVEQTVPMLSVIKLFIYAYTLEEKNGKSFYSLMNNDLRSGDKQKICRYLPMFYVIYSFLKDKYLKSYNGDVFRAAYFKKELIDEIKEGKKLLNASLWSSSKKLDVAKKFLFHYKKNILLHTKVKEGNNIDIHLENLSLYPDEEEVLFLPYCVFEVKSFNKVRENGLDYYKLDLIYCEEENKSNDIENLKFNDINLLPNNCDKKILI